MHFNFTISIIFICLLVILNACGIGHYHNLNLVRPDKKTSTTLVKPKHKTNKVTEVIKEDSAIAQINEESGLIKTANIVSERKETLIIPFLKKPSTKATKVKIGLKEKLVLCLLNNKVERINEKYKINTSNKNLLKPYSPNKPDLKSWFLYFLIIVAFLLSLIIGIVLLSIDLNSALRFLAIALVLFIIILLVDPPHWHFG